MKRVPLGVINISATPHTKDGSTYVELIQDVFNLDLAIKIRADVYAMIASCVALDEKDPLHCFTGEIHKFTEISGDWENVLKRKAADDEDIRAINIPEHLKPNREAFRYFLFPREHRFVFQLKGAKRSISHDSVKKFLEELFKSKRILSKYPLVTVVVEQEPAKLDEIFNMHFLESLYIHIERPNPGDGFDAEEIKRVEQMLRQQGAASYDVKLNHAPHEALKPNEANKKLARVARSNGKAIGKGKDAQNRPVVIDTSEHPIVEPFDYDSKAQQSFVYQMFRAARGLVSKIVRKQ